MPTDATSRWIKRWNARPLAVARLFCFPWAGGAAVAFRRWGTVFPPTIEVCAIEYPGRGSREAEPPLDEVASLASGVADAAKPLLDRPFGVLGYSLGALVAYEWLRLLGPRGVVPLHFFPCARRAPHFVHDAEEFIHLATGDFVRAVQRRFQAIPEPLLNEPEILERLIVPLRADLRAVDGYRYMPGPPLLCPVSAFSGSRDPDVTAHELAAWAEHTQGRFTSEQLDAGHFFLDSPRLRLALIEAFESDAA
jgi:surfactin synthase thioesterase subunit